MVAGAVEPPAEAGPPAEQPGEEGVEVGFFLSGAGEAEGEERGFVGEGEEGEVAGVLPGGFDDEAGFFAEGAGTEEEDHARKEGRGLAARSGRRLCGERRTPARGESGLWFRKRRHCGCF